MNYTHEEILKFLLIIDNYKNNEEGIFFSNKVRCKSSKKSDFFIEMGQFWCENRG